MSEFARGHSLPDLPVLAAGDAAVPPAGIAGAAQTPGGWQADGPDAGLHAILRQVFGHAAFRGRQLDVVRHVAAGGDALVLMPTGAGKSLCYQVPAIARQRAGCGVTVVISPLIALMHDQVQALRAQGVAAAFLNSTQDWQQAQQVERQLLEGSLTLLYAAPERVGTPRFADLLDALHARGQLALFAIDEAHCVSQWGHDFRPEYRSLAVLHQRWAGVPRVALTATADAVTRADIAERLQLQGAPLFVSSFDRPNIRYTIVEKADATQQLLQFINGGHLGEAGIVYCQTRRRCEEMAAALNRHGIAALAYHAGMDADERQRHQDRFLRAGAGRGLVMCATIAFGMGIDKPDVRFVAHVDMPKNIEGYYQETGRAGRDGQPAHAWMAYGLQDVVNQRRMIDESPAPEEFKQVMRGKLDALLALAEATDCRRRRLLAYFGEEMGDGGAADGGVADGAAADGAADGVQAAASAGVHGDAPIGACGEAPIGACSDAGDAHTDETPLETSKNIAAKQALARGSGQAQSAAAGAQAAVSAGGHGDAPIGACGDAPNGACGDAPNGACGEAPIGACSDAGDAHTDETPLETSKNIAAKQALARGRGQAQSAAAGVQASARGGGHAGCGNCDNCLNPPRLWDATDCARKLLSTIYRVQQMSGMAFGAGHICNILAGCTTPQVQRHGHERISTWGLGRDYTAAQMSAALRQLIALGAVQVRASVYNTLHLLPAARPILRGEQSLHLRAAEPAPRRGRRRTHAHRQAMPPGKAPPQTPPPQTPPPGAAADLDAPAQARLAALKAWRSGEAQRRQQPAFIIFHDATLAAIAQRNPQTLADLQAVAGVGAKKLAEYGEGVLRACAAAGGGLDAG